MLTDRVWLQLQLRPGQESAFIISAAMKGAAADSALAEGLALPVAPAVIYVASDPPGRSQAFVDRACGFQPGCAAALPDAEPEWQPQQVSTIFT